MTKLSKKEIKEAAQNDLLHFASIAFSRIPDDPANDSGIPLDQCAEFAEELVVQYRRVQKLFGIIEEDRKKLL